MGRSGGNCRRYNSNNETVKKPKFCLLLASLLSLVVDAAPVNFAAEIQPILKKRCYACHGPAQQISGLRLDAKASALAGGYAGPLWKAGQPEESHIIARVTGRKGLLIMPPAGPKVPDAEVELLRRWIAEGAVWPDDGKVPLVSRRQSNHWTFQPLMKPELPAVKDAVTARTAIDRFVLAKLESKAIAPAPPADKATLLRRLSLDVTGLPPSPEEMVAWLADNSDKAYEKQVERLLSSPHFGERWARPWLDRARYADSDGYEKDWVRPNAWRFRQWVIDAWNADMPFDQFTIEQVAGDQLPNATQSQLIATGFHRMTLTNREGGIDNKQFDFENAVDRANTVSATWLGLTMGCAQCHDHKYDPVSQKDFYSLVAFFENLEERDIVAPLPGEIGPWMKVRKDYRTKREALLQEYKIAGLMTDWEKRLLEANANPGKWTDWDLAWDCLLKLTERGDGEKIIRIPEAKRTARERDVLIDHFVKNYHFAVGWTKYGELKFRDLDKKLNELKTQYAQLSEAMTVAEAAGERKYFLRVRGDYRTNGIEVKRSGPSVLPAMADNATRLDLAKWLVSKENPLTWRVTVNWVWQEIFGRGIVRSTDDFGVRGDQPSHQEMLDWLAVGFREQKSLKSLVREIVLSSTYRQSSRMRNELRDVDPENMLLARQARLRMPAELIRDAALHASGLLNAQVGGRSIKPPQPAGVAAMKYASRDDSAWVETTGPEAYRRGLYIHFQRTTPYPLLMNFDGPRASVAQCRRERSNTSLQALNLLNDPVFFEAAEALAEKTAAVNNDAARAKQLFALVLLREPSAREQERMSSFLTRKAADELRWVMLASSLLNLDEFITRE
jgi:cytochrome c551/c552